MEGVADKVTERQLIRYDTTIELQEVSEDGSEENVKTQKREHWIYEFYQDVATLISIRDPALGRTYTSEELRFYPGGGQGPQTLPVVTDADGNILKWLCTADSLDPLAKGVDQFRNRTVMELYTPWVDHDFTA